MCSENGKLENQVAGIAGGAKEFLEAGEIVGLATTIGAECRADFSETRLAGRFINNPDQASLAYMAIHGIPHTKIDSVRDFFAPYSIERNKRNAAMTKRLNALKVWEGTAADHISAS